MSEKVVQLPIYNFRDPADMLRRIADEIDRGEHGSKVEITVAMLGKHFGLYSAGVVGGLDAGSCALLLQAGIQLLSQPVLEYEE